MVHYLYPNIDIIERVISLGMGDIYNDVPKLSMWMINLLNHPSEPLRVSEVSNVNVTYLRQFENDQNFKPGFIERGVQTPM